MSFAMIQIHATPTTVSHWLSLNLRARITGWVGEVTKFVSLLASLLIPPLSFITSHHRRILGRCNHLCSPPLAPRGFRSNYSLYITRHHIHQAATRTEPTRPTDQIKPTSPLYRRPWAKITCDNKPDVLSLHHLPLLVG